MAPKTKSKAKKGKGADTAPGNKRFRKAAKQTQAPADPQQDWVDVEDEVTGDESLEMSHFLFLYKAWSSIWTT